MDDAGRAPPPAPAAVTVSATAAPAPTPPSATAAADKSSLDPDALYEGWSFRCSLRSRSGACRGWGNWGFGAQFPV
jgi:hypothetical protein